MPRPEPKFDFTRIAFPSDRIAIKDLRRLFPTQFDQREGEFDDFIDHHTQLHELLRRERSTAIRAMAGALGISREQGDRFRAETDRTDLIELYVLYGLASGPHHAEQLIRDIEAQASAQARGQGSAPGFP